MDDVDHRKLYQGVRARLTALAAELDEAELDRRVPATPAWRVRDVYAHLGGATADIVAGNLDGVASDAWTQAQVDARSDREIGAVLDEWDRCAQQVEPLIADIPAPMRAMLIIDAITHEHDVRGAVGRPGERDSDAIDFAAASAIRGLAGQRADAPAIRLLTDDVQHLLGSGDAAASVTADRFELVRAALGRRSLDQIAAWRWTGDPDPTALVLHRFAPPRATPLVE